MKTNFIMSLWKPGQVLLILKTLSINVLIRMILYDRCETEITGNQIHEGFLTEGTSDNGLLMGIVD